MDESVLQPCPSRPNCVSTEATGRAHIEPIAFDSSKEDAVARLRKVLAAYPRTRIVSDDGTVIRAVFVTRLMRYRDDGVFLVDGERKVIRFRSASRLGRSDWGVNRRRMEEIRRLFEAQR